MRRAFECIVIGAVSLLACATTRESPDTPPKPPVDAAKIDAVTPEEPMALDAPKEPAEVVASPDIAVVEVTSGVNDAPTVTDRPDVMDAGLTIDRPAVLDVAAVMDVLPPPLPYPTRSAYRIKSIQPDFWPDMEEIAGNNAGGVAMNLVWAAWEPSVRAPPCASAREVEFDGHCFTIDAAVDDAIGRWTARGLAVTAVVYGTPAWSRVARCTPVSPGFEIFCAPNDPQDFARFAGMLARRYDGRRGHGRIADFVIQNEVNSNDWFDIGCGQSSGACDATAWIARYSDLYDRAYDAVVAEQPSAKVLISLEHHFGTAFDQPAAANPLLSGETFLRGFAARVGSRAWRVAYHPYPPDLLRPQFSPDDYPKVTYGSMGALVGWLRRTFPGVPSAWEVQFTESGVNSLAPGSSAAAQATGVCDSLRNALGTPGVENYVYHRMVDHPDEVRAGLGVGLRNADRTAKPAWAVWALANRNDLTPPMLSCGFEDLPYTRVRRSHHTTRGHWASSRGAPAGFREESSWRLWRDERPGTVLLYECRVGEHDLLTRDVNCEGLQPLGPVGWAYATQAAGTVAIHRCRVGAGTDHFISTDARCEGQVFEQTLGYGLPGS